MKKSLIFKILYLFLVLIVVAGASVFATNTYLSARDISYGSTNVEDALNGLFTLKGNDENYSTDEKVVGKWINNKPIYRKVIEVGSLTVNSGSWIESSIPCPINIENIISGKFINDDASLGTHLARNSKSTFNYQILGNYNQYIIKYLIVEYTKTTD